MEYPIYFLAYLIVRSRYDFLYEAESKREDIVVFFLSENYKEIWDQEEDKDEFLWSLAEYEDWETDWFQAKDYPPCSPCQLLDLYTRYCEEKRKEGKEPLAHFDFQIELLERALARDRAEDEGREELVAIEVEYFQSLGELTYEEVMQLASITPREYFNTYCYK